MSVISRGPASAQARALRVPDTEYAKVRTRLRKGPISIVEVPEPAPLNPNDPDSVEEYTLRAVLHDLEAAGQCRCETTVGKRLSDGRYSIVEEYVYVFATDPAVSSETASEGGDSPHAESDKGTAGHELVERQQHGGGGVGVSQRTGLEVSLPAWGSAPAAGRSYL